jgi:hypothetical protein
MMSGIDLELPMLIVTFVVLLLAAFAIVLGFSLFLQAYLYNAPVEKIYLRALVGGLAVAIFLTGWTYINTRADRENKYGAIHEFKPTGMTDINKFEAIRRNRSKVETTVAYSKLAGEREFRSDVDKSLFRVNTSDYITVAFLVKEEGKAEPTRFDAVLDGELMYDAKLEKKTFQEKGGPRLIEEDGIGVIVAPSGGVIFIAILINVLHLVVWFAVFWFVMKFTWPHALGLATVLAVVLTLVAMPLIFSMNKPLKTPGTYNTQPK